MLRDAKWISYVVQVLAAVHEGASTIAAIALAIKGSETYIAKVVASLRKAGFITKETSLAKPLEDITIKELLDLEYPLQNLDPVTTYVVSYMLACCGNLTARQVFDNVIHKHDDTVDKQQV